MSHLAKHLEDSDEDLFRGTIWELAVFLAEPAARKPFQVNGVRPFSRQSLIHVLGVSEEGVPVVACREVYLVLYCTNLKKERERTVIHSVARYIQKYVVTAFWKM